MNRRYVVCNNRRWIETATAQIREGEIERVGLTFSAPHCDMESWVGRAGETIRWVVDQKRSKDQLQGGPRGPYYVKPSNAKK
jgi:hypothetical protein